MSLTGVICCIYKEGDYEGGKLTLDGLPAACVAIEYRCHDNTNGNNRCIGYIGWLVYIFNYTFTLETSASRSVFCTALHRRDASIGGGLRCMWPQKYRTWPLKYMKKQIWT